MNSNQIQRNPPPGTFEILHEDRKSGARTGKLWTSHGPVMTPVFMPVGTLAAVNSLDPDDLHALDVQVVLSNTYHLKLRPGAETVAALGGLHSFNGWNGPILTDSGGFQVFSLAKLRTMKPDGVEFRSHIDGSIQFLGPVEAMRVQRLLASDIAMVFDECIPYPSPENYVRTSVEKTIEWAELSFSQPHADGQLVFGIVQGGGYADIRRYCAERLKEMDMPGYAVGGVSVGEPETVMMQALDASLPFLPAEKPRYVMGLGDMGQIAGAVCRGADMFDCIMPTRAARHGTVYTRFGHYPVKAALWKNDSSPVEEGCKCRCCRNFSRGYIRHLQHTGETLAARLITIHNLFRYMEFMRELREAISNDCFSDWCADFNASRGFLNQR